MATMSAMRLKPAAVLVLTIWCEGDDRSALRARITQTGDVTQQHGTTTVVAGTVDDVCAAVKSWVERSADGLRANPHGAP
jgi:hypothetical protein